MAIHERFGKRALDISFFIPIISSAPIRVVGSGFIHDVWSAMRRRRSGIRIPNRKLFRTIRAMDLAQVAAGATEFTALLLDGNTLLGKQQRIGAFERDHLSNDA